MSSPVITFRLTTYQLARGLQIVRSLEPNFQLTSLSQLVKIIYTDYLSKMTLGQSDEVSPDIMQEIQVFILNPRKKEINLAALADEENFTPSVRSNLAMPLPSEKTTSDISTITDFNPLTDWIDQEV